MSGPSYDAAGPGRRLPSWSGAAAVAIVLFVVAYQSGAYELTPRNALAIAVWWAVVLALAVGAWPRQRIPDGALLVGAALAGLALFTLLSAGWAAAAERAITEYNRTSLYVGLFLLGVLSASARSLRPWRDGLAIGLVAVALVALVSRFVPGTFGDQGLAELLPAAATRLSYPVGYWNGLAILVALAVPLLLGVGTSATSPIARGAAVGSIPSVAAVAVLSSSRGGALTAALGATVFVIASGRRWAAAWAAMAAGAASLGLAAFLLRQDTLLNGPLDSAAAATQGANAATALAVACLVCGGAYVLGTELARPFSVPPLVGWIAAGAALVALVAALVAADPARRFESFRQAPELTAENPDFVRAHLLSTGGSGRWQFWQAGIEQWRGAPVHGRGAGSFETWWAQHGTLPLVARDAHSLYVETLGELGLVGLALLLVAFGGGALVATRRLRGRGPEREVRAALTAGFVAFAAAAALDWVWELTVVGAVGILLLGLCVSAGIGDDVRAAGPSRYALGLATIAAGWIVLVLQALPLLAEREVRRSQAAAARGAGAEAEDHARTAARIQPWSAAPRLQAALVAERLGELAAARTAAAEAISRDPENWVLWLVAARLETKAGALEEAKRSLRRAEELNPRSPVFAR